MSKTVVITGGHGDIAKAIAEEIESSTDYKVLLPSKELLDVTNIDNISKYFKDVKPDILINNAGAIHIDGIAKNNVLVHKRVIEVNLTGVFACTSEALKHKPKAKIINIGSSAGTKVHGDWSSYCAAKAGVIMATSCWAEEGIDTICISPGRTSTKMRKSMYPNEDSSMLMKPRDFAKVVVKAMNNEYKNGINLAVNVSNVGDLINE